MSFVSKTIYPLLQRRRIPYFLFQVVAIRPEVTKTDDGKEVVDYTITSVEEQVLAVKPSSIRYSEKGTAYVGFTLDNKMFIDEPGILPNSIVAQGTFGARPRRVGGQMLTPFTRFRLFRDKVFRLSKAVDADTAAKIVWGISNADDISQTYLRNVVGDKVVYAVNFFDFYFDESYAVYIDSFDRSGQAQKGDWIDYTISMKGLGEPLRAIPRDPLALALFGYDALWNATESLVGELAEGISFSETGSLGELPDGLDIFGYVGGIADGVAYMRELVDRLVAKAAALDASLQGETVNEDGTTTQGYKSFREILGMN
jgi:hypothetical protein